MQELRPDFGREDEFVPTVEEIDDLVIAPTEPLDDRDSEDVDFEVIEELSCSNTDFGAMERQA